MATLVACPDCTRHIRRVEASCPFCGAQVASRIAGLPEPVLPKVRLSRAALMAFAAASVGAAGCSAEAVYGAPSPPNAGGLTSTGGAPSAGGTTSTGGASNVAGAGIGGLTPAYGAPFPGFGGRDGDSGVDATAGGSVGTGGVQSGGGAAIYGAAPAYGIPPKR